MLETLLSFLTLELIWPKQSHLPHQVRFPHLNPHIIHQVTSANPPTLSLFLRLQSRPARQEKPHLCSHPVVSSCQENFPLCSNQIPWACYKIKHLKSIIAFRVASACGSIFSQQPPGREPLTFHIINLRGRSHIAALCIYSKNGYGLYGCY